MAHELHLTTPGGTPITLILGVGNDYRAAVRSVRARGKQVATGDLRGTRLTTTRGDIELGKAGASELRKALGDLDREYAVAYMSERAAVDATRKATEAKIADATRREVATAEYEDLRDARERRMTVGGWQ